MKVFDLSQTKAFPYEKRGKNVLFQTEEFKTRIIELSPGGKLPPCKMSEYVVFIVLEGEMTIEVNSEKKDFKEMYCLITEPATLSMQTQKGVRILGLQITAASASAS